MAVTVIDRPLGHKLGTEAFNGAVTNASGDALVTRYVGIVATPHGLTDGDYVYIESSMDSYNGFYEIDVITPETYKLVLGDAFVSYKQYNELFYYVSDLEHGWQCVHLPIVYELSNDFYPVNSVDTAASIIIYTDYNGYLSIGHNALTGGSALSVLDYVRLTDGVNSIIVQVIGVPLTTNTYVDLPYGGYTYTTIQKVRNNYHIDINVYAGLPSGHPWEAEKPYELATTLRFIPDSNNRIKFSIAEILKGYINTRNNLTLDTLPNNIDFFTAFYIEYAEGYDVSNGTEITAFLDEFTDDSEEFEGYAVNAMLPFKNLYSGHISQYVDSTEVLARWLTTMDVPIIFIGLFFDLSFINTHEGDIKINKNGVLYMTITDPGIGVLRVPIEAESGDTEICIQAWIGSGETDYNIAVFSGGEDWSIGADASITLDSNDTSSELSQAVYKQAGTYNICWDISVIGNEGLFTIEYKKDGVVVGSVNDQSVTSGSNVACTSITLTDDADELVFYIYATLGVPESTGSYTLSALSISGEQYITESICLQVVSECNTFIADDLRLIETGPFRELE